MFKYLISTFVLVFALSTTMAQNKADKAPSKKETITQNDNKAGANQDAAAKPESKTHGCKPGCKATCCAKKDSKACAPGCTKPCCSKSHGNHDHKHDHNHNHDKKSDSKAGGTDS